MNMSDTMNTLSDCHAADLLDRDLEDADHETLCTCEECGEAVGEEDLEGDLCPACAQAAYLDGAGDYERDCYDAGDDF